LPFILGRLCLDPEDLADAWDENIGSLGASGATSFEISTSVSSLGVFEGVSGFETGTVAKSEFAVEL
jgi:hypothetical protein